MDELNESQFSIASINVDNPSEQSFDNSLQSENTEQSASSKKKHKSGRPIRPFPQFSIKEAMEVPKVIGANNAGNPWAVEHIAAALNTAKGTTRFFYLTSASRDYGFTLGTSKAKLIELSPQGRKLVFPATENDETQAITQAFYNIDIFKKVYEYYNNGASLPEDKYLCNTLKEIFGIDASYHQDFISIFKDNLDLIAQIGCIESFPAISHQAPDLSEVEVQNRGENGELFVIMPFSEKTPDYAKGYFDEVYSSLLVPATLEAGLTPKTAKRSGSDIIHSTIVSDIYNAQIVLADLTEHNPNVLFELGLAIAFKKRVVLIRAKGTPAIFDVDNLMRVYDYDRNLWKSTIERDVPNLCKHIQAALQTEGTMYLDILLKK